MSAANMNVVQVAKLANLTLTPEEEKLFTAQMAAILDYISQLQQVHTANVDPTSQVTGLTNVVREDQVEPSLTLDQDYFRVKAILDND